MNNQWELYDALIDEIPVDLVVEDCLIGLNWTYVRSGPLAGVAMTVRGNCVSGLSGGPIIGRKLKDVAAGLKSWDMLRSTVGMAACNAWFNDGAKMKALGLCQGQDAGRAGSGGNIFDEPLENLFGKKVAVIGHFPYIEKKLGEKCTLVILERDPEEGDYLDSACEYLLPEQDYVFITGMTLTNKTLPRLLTLTQNAKTVMVGPSVPVTPTLFRFGVDTMAGFYVTDCELAKGLIAQAAHTEVFQSGCRITYSR